MTTTLIADTREQNVNTNLQPDSVQQLSIGDFQIHVDNIPVLYIERKTAHDLITSIKDGRYKEQKERLSQVKHVYIIEDPSILEHSDNRVSSTVLSLTIRDQHPIIMSRSIIETVQWIHKMKHKIQKDTNKFLLDNNSSYIKNTTPNDKIQPSNALVYMLSQIPNVSYQTATSIHQRYKSISDLVQNGSSEDIQSILIQSSGKRIGKKIAERIMKYVYAEENV